MEISQIKIMFRLGYKAFLALIIVPLVCSCIGDITQYKRLSNTDYYLVEQFGIINIYYKHREGFWGESINHKGDIKYVYWNDDYIIVKCTDGDSPEIINYCIIEQYGRNSPYVPWIVHEYGSESEYITAKDSIGLVEESMNFSDTYIPWRLH